jgi:esterase/lipase superfamily enzyme
MLAFNMEFEEDLVESIQIRKDQKIHIQILCFKH